MTGAEEQGRKQQCFAVNQHKYRLVSSPIQTRGHIYPFKSLVLFHVRISTFNTKPFYFLSIEYIYVFCVNNRKYTDCSIKNQLDATYYFIVLLIGSTCFGHCYSVGCSPDTTPAEPYLTSNLQQTKNETTNVVINIIVVSS